MKQSLKNSHKFDVSIIIVSYNTKFLTLQCIKSVIRSIKKLKYEIIVIDNASTDGSAYAIGNYLSSISFPDLKIVENKRNLGFAKANNQGINIACGKYVLLLNSDTKIKNNALEEMVALAKNNTDTGAVGPRLLNIDGSIQPSVYRLPTLDRAIKQYWLGEKNILDKYFPDSKKPTAVESLVMAAFLITPKALKKVGLLDERYFMYYEDLDYCRRLQKNKLKIFYLPCAEVFHYHGASGDSETTDNKKWHRLIPSSKIYHGLFVHYVFNFVIWSSQKLKKNFCR